MSYERLAIVFRISTVIHVSIRKFFGLQCNSFTTYYESVYNITQFSVYVIASYSVTIDSYTTVSSLFSVLTSGLLVAEE